MAVYKQKEFFKLRDDVTLFIGYNNSRLKYINENLYESIKVNDNIKLLCADDISDFHQYLSEFVMIRYIRDHIDEIKTPYVGFCQYRYIYNINEINNSNLDKDSVIFDIYNLYKDVSNQNKILYYEMCNQLTTDEIDKCFELMYSIEGFENIKNDNMTHQRESFICSKEMFVYIVNETEKYLNKFYDIFGIEEKDLPERFKIIPRCASYFIEMFIVFILESMAKSGKCKQIRNNVCLNYVNEALYHYNYKYYDNLCKKCSFCTNCIRNENEFYCNSNNNKENITGKEISDCEFFNSNIWF